MDAKTNQQRTQPSRVLVSMGLWNLSSKLSALDSNRALATMREILLDRAALDELDSVAREIASRRE